jgi:hypothetical protein
VKGQAVILAYFLSNRNKNNCRSAIPAFYGYGVLFDGMCTVFKIRLFKLNEK